MTDPRSSSCLNAAAIAIGLIFGAWGAEERAAEVPALQAPPADDRRPAIPAFSLWDLYAAPPSSLSILYGPRLIYIAAQPSG